MTATTCPSYEELVLRATDDLSSDDKAVVDTHIIDCITCRQELAALQITLASMPDNSAPLTNTEVSAFTSRVVAATTTRRQRYFLWEGAATFASILLIAFFVFKPDTVSEPKSFDVPVASELAVLNDFDLILNLELLEDLELLEFLEERG